MYYIFTVLILVCPGSLAQRDCNVHTAYDHINGPMVKNEIECGLYGQAQLASTALKPRAKLDYTKIVCLRKVR